MIFSILACGKSGEIGKDGKLPWEGRFRKDQQYYLRKTTNQIRVGTRGSIATLNETRPSYFVSRSPEQPEFCLGVFDWTLMSPKQILIEIQKNHPKNDVYVVGGTEWYCSSAYAVDQIFLTRIDQNFEATTYVDLDRLLYNRKLLSKKVVHEAESMTFETWE